jgi:hypothetical protein
MVYTSITYVDRYGIGHPRLPPWKGDRWRARDGNAEGNAELLSDDNGDEVRPVHLSPGAAHILEELSNGKTEKAILRARCLWLAIYDLATKFGQSIGPGDPKWSNGPRPCFIATTGFLIFCEVSWDSVYVLEIIDHDVFTSEPMWPIGLTPPGL